MKKNLPGYIVFILCLLTTSVWAVPGSVRNIQGSERLIDIRVNCLYKDMDGFIWVGTGGSVERYDGVRSLNYPFTKTTIEPEECLVTSIIETVYHEYWVGNVKGLWRLDHARRVPERMFPEKIDFMVRSLAKDQENNLYIATPNGLYIYNGEGLEHILIEKNTLSPNNQIVDVCVDSNGQVWLLTHTGVGLYEPRSGVIKYTPQSVLPEQMRFTCMTSQQGTLYLGTEAHGVISFDCNNFTYAGFSGQWKAPVTALSGDGKDVLYVGCNGEGICLINTIDKNILFSKTYNPQEGGLTSNSVACLLVEENKYLWVGYKFYSGMDYIDISGKVVDVFSTPYLNSETLIVRSFCTDGEATLIGTREGLYYLSSPHAPPIHYTNKGKTGEAHSNVIYSVYPYEGNYLIGTLNEGVFVLDPVTQQMSSPELFRSLDRMDVFAFRNDKSGNLWIPAVGGLFCFRKETKELIGYRPENSNIPSHIVYAVMTDSKERIWVATGKGLSLLDQINNTFRTDLFPENFFSHEVIRDIYEDKNGNLFFCSLDGHVFMTDSDLQKRVCLFASPAFQVYNVIQDNAGGYWFGTSIGIIRGNETLDNFTMYTEIDGMPDKNISPGSSVFKDEEGKIWYATIKGLISIDPSLSYETAPVMLTDIYINGKESYTTYNGLMNRTEPLRMKNSENNLTFRFASLGYEDTELLLFEYQLEGIDSTWVTLSQKNEVVYYDIPSGQYTFKVRKFLNNDSLYTVAFVIKSPWQNVWLFLGIAVFLVLVIGGIMIKTKNKSKEKEEDNITYEDSKEKYKYTRISEQEAQAIIEKLTSYMHQEKPYLNPDLKLPDLAAATGYSTNLLSQVINVFLNIRYYDFVNQYRVEEFQRLVRETDYSKYTLITLSEKCGFSSQASFFRFFKKSTGLTPSEYIQQIEKQRR